MTTPPPPDLSDLLSRGMSEAGLLLTEDELPDSFFDLRTGMAGELLQKFVNYRIPLVIVVADPKVHGDRFAELAREHRSHPMVRILPGREEGEAWLEEVRG